MEFRNALPDDKETPHIIHSTSPPSYSCAGSQPPQYSCDNTTASSSSTSTPTNIRWTTQRCARWDLIMHILSLTLGLPCLTLYTFDLGKSLTYHVSPLPLPVSVISSLAISFLTISTVWSVIYLLLRLDKPMSRGTIPRKWPTILDLCLHTGLLGLADSTFSLRGAQSACQRNAAVGGCDEYRLNIMAAAGGLLICVVIPIQVRFVVTCHAAYERKRLRRQREIVR